MKKFIYALLFSATLFAGAAQAAQNIAFVDADAAILNSEPAREKIAELKARYAPEKNKIKELEESIRGMQTKLQQDSAVMSDSEKRNLANEIEIKAMEYQQRVKKLQESQMQGQQELMDNMGPKFKDAVNALMEENGYTILMHLKAALIVDPADNLTRRVTEKLNANP